MKWKDKLQQKYNYWSTSFQSSFSLYELSQYRTIQLHCSASRQKSKFRSTAAYFAPQIRNAAVYIWCIATQDSVNWAKKLSRKTEVQMAKINMEKHYVS